MADQPTAFDPNTFLHAQQTEVNEKRPALPVENPEDANGLYTSIIGEFKPPKSGTIGKGDKMGWPWIQIPVTHKVQIPAAVQALGIPKELTITDGVFIDLLQNGSIDNSKGKNNRQRIYRDATGTNVPGEPFAWAQLEGKVVKVKIVHEDYQGSIQERIGMVFSS